MIPKNAITMRGRIDRCWLIAFRAPFDLVRAVVPPALEVVGHGEFAYLNVVVSELSQMRPAGVPAFLGLRYRHAAYRAYVRFAPANTEGLYFLRSDADHPLMVAAGNRLTDFQFHRAAISISTTKDRTVLSVGASDAPLRIVLGTGEPTLRPDAPFPDLATAAEALKYHPAGISLNDREVDVIRITRDESQWRFRLLPILECHVPFLDRFQAVPEIAYELRPIEYRWNRADRYPIPS